MFSLLSRSFWQFYSESPVVIIGTAFIAIGIALGFLSRRITKSVRRKEEISTNDKLFLTLKITGIALVLVGFLCITVTLVVYFAKR